MWKYLGISLLCLSLGAPMPTVCANIDEGRRYALLSRSAPTSIHPALTLSNATGWPPAMNWYWALPHLTTRRSTSPVAGAITRLDRRLRRPDRQGPGPAGAGATLSSRPAAVAALKSGRIDLLGSANGYEVTTQGLALSRPYAIDQPVLVTREDETRALDTGLDGMRLSMLYHYLPPEEIRANYPKAELLTFESSTQALNAVAFEQADVFIGDTVSTHYLISQGTCRACAWPISASMRPWASALPCVTTTRCCWPWSTPPSTPSRAPPATISSSAGVPAAAAC
jgi:two-component system sensor histidine kinase EvgS